LSRRKYDIVLSELAQDDLSDILQHTFETWGARQMDIYAAKLERGMRLLEDHPLLGKVRDDWFPGCHCHQVEQHVVLYEIVEHEIRIARLFHKRMDPKLHL
jgi:toxin ParE1/3/4